MGQPRRVGIIGGEFGARSHTPILRAEGYEVVAVATSREATASAAAQANSIPEWTADAVALAQRDDLDLIVVASPPALHEEHVLAALAAGKHVICEKPFALNAHQGERMLAAAQHAGVVHAMDFEFRFAQSRVLIKEIIDRGDLGDVRAVNFLHARGAARGRQLDGWLANREAGGGVAGARVSHLLDTLCWWLGDVSRVSAELDAFEGGARSAAVSDDQCALLLRFTRGTVASVVLTDVVGGAADCFDILGSEASLRMLGTAGKGFRQLVETPRVVLVKSDGSQQELLGPSGPAEQARAMRAQLRQITARIEGRPAEFATFEDGLRVQRILDAAYAQRDAYDPPDA